MNANTEMTWHPTSSNFPMVEDAERAMLDSEYAKPLNSVRKQVKSAPRPRDGISRQLIAPKRGERKTEIARVHGLRCFWPQRGVGPCSDDAEAGHIVARCHGGELSIEQYLADKRETGGSRP